MSVSFDGDINENEEWRQCLFFLPAQSTKSTE